MDRARLLGEIEEQVRDCRRCELHRTRTRTVFGSGPGDPRILFVGEAPGRAEDQAGTPFVGPAGALFDRILQAAGIRRADTYITNLVKCRPPSNRTPDPGEVGACLGYLHAQIALLRPPFVVPLGRPAACILLEVDEPIGKLRGQWREHAGLRIFPTYHPAALLRQEELKRPVWEDFKKIREAYRRTGREGTRP